MATKTMIATSGPANPTTGANWTGSSALANSDNAYVENSNVAISGADQSAVTLSLLEILASYRGTIGSAPSFGAPGTPWKIGATTCNIGRKVGGGAFEVGSNQIILHLHTAQTALTVFSTALQSLMADYGLPPLLISGSHANNVFNIIEGWVGIAMNGVSDAAQFATMNMGKLGGTDQACRVKLGAAVTWADIVKNSGDLLIRSAGTNFTQHAGRAQKDGSGTIASAKVYGGTFIVNDGDITDLEYSPGAFLDFTQSRETRAVTNLTFNGPESEWKKWIAYDKSIVTIPDPTVKGIVPGAQAMGMR